MTPARPSPLKVVCWAAALAVAPVAAAPAPPDAAPLPPRLAVLAESGLTRPLPGMALYDAGPISRGETPRLRHTFTLTNATGRPVLIARLRGSCGCESLRLLRGGLPVPQALLRPREQAQVEVSFLVAGLPAGPLEKTAWVFGADGRAPLATLAVAAALRPSAQFTPANLDFGSVRVGEAAVRELSVVVDRSTLRGKALPPLLSSVASVSAAVEGTAEPATWQGRPALRAHYQVRLAPQASSGALSGALTFAGAPPGDAVAGVSGTVLGHFAASPSALFFGSLAAGQDRTRHVVLSADAPDGLMGLTVAGSQPWLAAALEPGAASGGRPLRLLAVTLRAAAPVGSLQAQVTVTAPDGERLLIPVIAEVTPRPR